MAELRDRVILSCTAGTAQAAVLPPPSSSHPTQSPSTPAQCLCPTPHPSRLHRAGPRLPPPDIFFFIFFEGVGRVDVSLGDG